MENHPEGNSIHFDEFTESAHDLVLGKNCQFVNPDR